MELVDSHVHLDDPQWPPEALLASVEAARGLGLGGALLAGFGPERHERAREICQAVPICRRAVGLHPWWVARHSPTAWPAALAAVEAELSVEPRPVAIGEIGLDRNWRPQAPAELQEAAFSAALALAARRDLPVILHVVGWHGRALALVGCHGGRAGGVVHRYSGPPELARAWQQAGYSLSYGFEVLRAGAARQIASLRATAPERLLLETDWPLDERPYESDVARLPALVAAVATLRGQAAEEVASGAAANARLLFGLPGR